MNAEKSVSQKNTHTLPALLIKHAEAFGDNRIALREKEHGIWQSVTWSAYLEHVRDFSLGLTSLGLKPGIRNRWIKSLICKPNCPTLKR